MSRFGHGFTLILLLLVVGTRSEGASPTEADAPAFAPGQVWTYETRPHEDASRIIVCRVESDPKLGEIVHIYVDGLRLKNGEAPNGYSDHIGHMPYASEPLRKSCLKLESTRKDLPQFEGGYRHWRSAFDKGKAGVWTAPVSEAIAGTEKILAQ